MATLKCTNEECGHTFSDEAKRCPYCGTPVSEKNEMVDAGNTDESFWVLLWKFLHLYEEMTPSKAFLLLGGEVVFGIVFMLLGWLMSSNSGHRGNSTGAICFLIGGILLFYSLYAIIKHTTKQIMCKKNPSVREIKIRVVALFAELVAGGLLFLFGNSISNNRDVADMFEIMAVGMALVAVLSIIRFLLKLLFDRKKEN